jgi:hypothetical protein
MAGIAVTYKDATTFEVPGNRTKEFLRFRRVKASLGSEGNVYSSVRSSTYDSEAEATTVVLFDECLTPSLSEVWYGAISPGDEGAFPTRLLKQITKRQVLIFG